MNNQNVNDLEAKTVLIISDGHQITFDGVIHPSDFVGLKLQKEVDEVVDNYLVHTFTIIDNNPLNREFEEFNSYSGSDAINEILNYKDYLAETNDERLFDAVKRLEVLGKELTNL